MTDAPSINELLATVPLHGPTRESSIAPDPTWGGRVPSPITAALMQSEDPAVAPMWLLWRTGRKVGRTIYAQIGEQPSDGDVLIGMMDTRELADEAVRAHNLTLARVQA
jgi:hypothetical protein